jgi:hypothetical protein
MIEKNSFEICINSSVFSNINVGSYGLLSLYYGSISIQNTSFNYIVGVNYFLRSSSNTFNIKDCLFVSFSNIWCFYILVDTIDMFNCTFMNCSTNIYAVVYIYYSQINITSSAFFDCGSLYLYDCNFSLSGSTFFNCVSNRVYNDF